MDDKGFVDKIDRIFIAVPMSKRWMLQNAAELDRLKLIFKQSTILMPEIYPELGEIKSLSKNMEVLSSCRYVYFFSDCFDYRDTSVYRNMVDEYANQFVIFNHNIIPKFEYKHVENTVLKFFNWTKEMYQFDTRKREYVTVRHLVVYFSMLYTKETFYSLEKLLPCGSDRCNMMAAVKKIKNHIQTNRDFKMTVSRIENLLFDQEYLKGWTLPEK